MARCSSADDVIAALAYAREQGHEIAEGRARVRAGLGRWSRDRLARVKAEWDPDNVFRANQNLAPADSP